jgi:hypothetical protein
MAIEANNFATKSDIDRLEVLIESLDKRLAVIQWIGVIFLALNGSLIATLLWTLATMMAR